MDWDRTWLTNFNFRKCKVLRLGTQTSIESTYSMSYSDGLHQLIRVEEETDLGVLFSSTLKN